MNEILELLKIKYPNQANRKRKYTYEYYLKMITEVPDMGITWDKLPKVKRYGLDLENIQKYHYKTICDML